LLEVDEGGLKNMDTAVSLLIAILLAAALWFGFRWFFRSRSKYGGPRIVTCPETGRPTIVEVDALHASLTSTVRLPDIRLKDCSRWPIKKECGQECLTDLDVAPEQCLVSGVLMHWYRGKKCVFCNHPFAELNWTDHQPALRSPSGRLVAWKDVQLDDVRNVLETHLPVCWNCYIAQSFRMEHPDLVVFRPGRQSIPGDTGRSHVSHRP
jgi:hypothetical protein